MRKLLASALLFTCTLPCFGWGRTGHMMINRIAAEKLPASIPEFLRSPKAIEQLEYQGPEPDRWYNAGPELIDAASPDHFMDMEYAGFVGQLPNRRFDFVRALAAAQPQHPDIPLTPEKVGMQPYAVVEIWERLMGAMRDYRALVKDHKPTAPVQALIIYYAGWLGHYVGDGSQPLHTTVNYNGWTYGPNPNGYTTERGIHSKFESLYVLNNIKHDEVAALVPEKVTLHQSVFTDYVAYLTYTHSFVEKTYQLDKEKAFDGAGTEAGKQFALERIAAGATELRDLIVSAWEASSVPLPPSKFAD